MRKAPENALLKRNSTPARRRYTLRKMIELIIGAAVAGGTYLYAKKKKATTGASVAAGAATGVVGYAVTAGTLALLSVAWPVVLIGGAVAGGYYMGKKKNQKALPPAPNE